MCYSVCWRLWEARFAGGVGGVEGDALCATLYGGGCGGLGLREALEVSKVETVDGGLSFWVSKFPLWQHSRY